MRKRKQELITASVTTVKFEKYLCNDIIAISPITIAAHKSMNMFISTLIRSDNLLITLLIGVSVDKEVRNESSLKKGVVFFMDLQKVYEPKSKQTYRNIL